MTQFKYGFEDGKLRTKTDENSQITTFCYWTGGCSGSSFDPFVRLTGIQYPDTGVSTFAYSDAGPSPSVTATKAITSTLNMVSTTTYDAIGHPVQTALSSDPDGATYAVTTYDGMGKPRFVYNPTRCSTPTTNCGERTWGFSTYTYDALGRTINVAEQDGSSVQTSYSSNQTTVTDEAGNQRTSQSDALGRLTYVWEAPNNTNYNYKTVYAYDALNNLLSVNQNGSRTRTFTYDSLARLLCAANPEIQIVTCPASGTTFPAGAITYTYDSNGNLSSKVAPSPGHTTGTATVTTNYSYDALNRLTQKAYVGLTMSKAKFGYDGTTLTSCGQNPPTITAPTNLVGRRSAICAGKSGSSWSYDPMGRPLLESRINAGSKQKNLSVSYAYNKDGSLNTLTYPSGDVVTYTVGGAGRVTAVNDSSNNYVGPYTKCCAVVSHAVIPNAVIEEEYAPFGGLGGISRTNPVILSRHFSPRRLQHPPATT